MFCGGRHELGEVQTREAADRARLLGRAEAPAAFEAGLHKALDADVQEMFRGKGYEELCELDEQIKSQAGAPVPGCALHPRTLKTQIPKILDSKP